MAYHQSDIPTLERQTFVETFKYKLIYVYTIYDKKHEGYLKVGDTDVVSALVPDQLTPTCKTLNDAARARIDQQTQTGPSRSEMFACTHERFRSLAKILHAVETRLQFINQTLSYNVDRESSRKCLSDKCEQFITRLLVKADFSNGI